MTSFEFLLATYVYRDTVILRLSKTCFLYLRGHNFKKDWSMVMKFGWVEHEVIVVKQTETEALPMWKLLVMM